MVEILGHGTTPLCLLRLMSETDITDFDLTDFHNPWLDIPWLDIPWLDITELVFLD
ncbi:hypothetical protein [Gordonia sp. MP11Mi]